MANNVPRINKKWMASAYGKVKVNFEGAVDKELGKASLGVIIKDEKEEIRGLMRP